ncbi:MAG TPA: type I-E CRISPR-associated protein Cse2/CasB [Deltaproteobacteria bacterium]|nr:type I-E CRISPR-associated protein Cse2/CasB [Deltaproteobacteria bacterium]
MPDLDQPTSLAGLVRRLAARIDSDALSPGDRASLRKLDPEHPPLIFWKMVAADEELGDQLHRPGGRRAERWAAVLQALAILGELRSDQIYLGRALAEARFSELRLERLLRGDEASQLEHVRLTARFLAAKGQAVEPTHLARLILEDDPERAETLRRDIARAYFHSLHRATTQET